MAGFVPRITLWSKDFVRLYPITYCESIKLVLKWNQISTLDFVVSGDHIRLADIMRPGARVTVDYVGRRIFSGPVRKVSGEGPSRQAKITVHCEDDIRLLWCMLCYPSGKAVDAGTGADRAADGHTLTDSGGDVRFASEYAWYSGPAEDVAKNIIASNAVRSPYPLVAGSNRHRGRKISISTRFHVFADRVLPLIEGTQMTMRLFQVDPWSPYQGNDSPSIVFECEPARRINHTYTEDSGSITSWEFVQDAPSATMVVTGGGGEGVQRRFNIMDNSRLDREYGDHIEIFKDSRNADSQNVNLRDENTGILGENVAKNGFKITLSESESLHFGPDSIVPGDFLTIDIGSGHVWEIVREIELVSESPGDGWTAVTPVAGEYSDNPSAMLAKRIAGMASVLRQQATF